MNKKLIIKIKEWLKNEEGGECANLRNTNLSHAYLRNAKNLDYAYIRLIDLKDAIKK